MKITNNFNLEEFTSKVTNYYEQELITILAENLQKVRDMLQEYAVPGKNVSITITSGVRTEDDYLRLVKKGYNPSKTSDHFYGYQLKSLPTIGAADLKINNCKLSMKEIAAKLIEWNKENKINFGQIIYEYNPSTKYAWIHVGNDWNSIFSDRLAKVLSKYRKKYLMSLDNGKTYIDFK